MTTTTATASSFTSTFVLRDAHWTTVLEQGGVDVEKRFVSLALALALLAVEPLELDDRLGQLGRRWRVGPLLGLHRPSHEAMVDRELLEVFKVA